MIRCFEFFFSQEGKIWKPTTALAGCLWMLGGSDQTKFEEINEEEEFIAIGINY